MHSARFLLLPQPCADSLCRLENEESPVSIAPFEALVDRLRAGDAEAAAEVFHRYVGQLVGLASGRLAGLLRAQADPEDVVQSVFRSFFTRQQQGQFDLR